MICFEICLEALVKVCSIRAAIIFLLFGCFVLAPVALGSAEREGFLLGNWVCESGPCSDQEIQLTMEDEQRLYNSWLHERPSAVNGTWRLAEEALVVECCGGLRFEWEVLEVGEDELRLREKDGGEEIVYFRVDRDMEAQGD